MQQLIATSKNNIKVTFDPTNSHAATHLEDTPQLKGLVVEVVSNLLLNGQEVAKHFDLGRVVGTCDVVRVNDSDKLVYGLRKNRVDDGYVPFVMNREGDSCQFIALHLLTKQDNTYELLSAWIGKYGEDEPFPQSKLATKLSIDYWKKHAFIHGSQEIILNSETNNCPW